MNKDKEAFSFIQRFLFQMKNLHKEAQRIRYHYEETMEHSNMLHYVVEPIQSWCRDDKNWSKSVKYSFHIHRVPFQIVVYFPHNHSIDERKMLQYIVMWFLVSLNYAPPSCKKNFRFFIYLTPFLKRLPTPEVITEFNVNTGLTQPCLDIPHKDGVVYRSEEWFKVLIHESFHLLGLDKSIDDAWDRELSHFLIRKTGIDEKPELGLYESYTEFWAELFHLFFRAYDEVKEERHIARYFKTILKEEQAFSDMQTRTVQNMLKRQYKFNNDTVKLHSYFTFKNILIQNVYTFVDFCIKTNGREHPFVKVHSYENKKKTLKLWDHLVNHTKTRKNRQNNSNSLRMTHRDLKCG